MPWLGDLLVEPDQVVDVPDDLVENFLAAGWREPHEDVVWPPPGAVDERVVDDPPADPPPAGPPAAEHADPPAAAEVVEPVDDPPPAGSPASIRKRRDPAGTDSTEGGVN